MESDTATLDSNTAISVRNLRKAFPPPFLRKSRGDVIAVDNLSFDVPKHGIFVLLGSNGYVYIEIQRELITTHPYVQCWQVDDSIHTRRITRAHIRVCHLRERHSATSARCPGHRSSEERSFPGADLSANPAGVAGGEALRRCDKRQGRPGPIATRLRLGWQGGL